MAQRQVPTIFPREKAHKNTRAMARADFWEKGAGMDNAAKLEAIREWVDPQERVTVDFLDEKGVTAVITECTNEYVVLSLEPRFLHLRQHLCVPMRQVEVGVDQTHYTRDPEKPLRHSRLRLMICQSRPHWV